MLQSWLQLAAYRVVRGSAQRFMSAGEVAYGTAVNRRECDHDGLAVCGCVSAGRADHSGERRSALDAGVVSGAALDRGPQPVRETLKQGRELFATPKH